MFNRARAEWDPLTEVLVHRPGIEMFFGLLEPYAFLYERAFSIDRAVREHGALERALTRSGVEVHRLKRFAVAIARRRPELLERLRAAVPDLVTYRGPRRMVEPARRALLRDRDVYDAETLFNIELLRPSIDLRQRRGTRVILPTVRLDTPLANLCYLRDQQALGPRGFLLGRMAKPQRAGEPPLVGGLLRAAGAEIAGSVAPPGTFEGGDFLPLGRTALLGTGDRTNAAGVRQVLGMPLGLDEVAVVHQPTHPALPGRDPDPMINMHVDTYVNVAGPDLAVGSVPLLRRARVARYRRRGERFRREPGSLSLHDYLRAQRFEIVPISTLEQMCYASNFLCLRDRRIVAVEVGLEVDRVVAALRASAERNPARYAALYALVRKERGDRDGRGQYFPHLPALRDAGVQATALSLREITGGYGGAHCLTCVLNRSGSGPAS